MASKWGAAFQYSARLCALCRGILLQYSMGGVTIASVYTMITFKTDSNRGTVTKLLPTLLHYQTELFLLWIRRLNMRMLFE